MTPLDQAIHEYASRSYYVSMASRIMKNAEDSEDVVQRTFLLAFTKIEQFHGSSGMRTWITAILRHACFDTLRTLRSRPEGYLYWQAEEEYPDYGWLGWEQPVAERAMIEGQRMAEVYRAIERLSENQQRAVYHYLKHGDLVSHNSTLKVQKARALKRLRGMLRVPSPAIIPTCPSSLPSVISISRP